jgi:protein-disulfide isomerase
MNAIRTPEPRLAVPVGSEDHVIGSDSAGITLVEYGDFECPYCARAAPVVSELRRVFGDDLRFVFRNMPLAEIHPHAEHAAQAAEAVALQGRFWEMHDLLFGHRADLSDVALLRYAAQAGADATLVAEALRLGTTRARVERDVDGGIRSGVTGTPTFFVNGTRYDGSSSLEPFSEYLRGLSRPPRPAA